MLLHLKTLANKIMEASVPLDKKDAIKLPVVDKHYPGIHVDVLNAGGYVVNGKQVVLPSATKPIPIEAPDDKNLDEGISQLKNTLSVRSTQIVLRDATTETAIATVNGHKKIALIFANENHAGGGPGFYKSKSKEKFVYVAASAPAQEESVCIRSTLFASLSQLDHYVIRKQSFPRSMFGRNGVKIPLGSKQRAYVCEGVVFGLRVGRFHESKFLESPVPVCFLISAADCYGSEEHPLEFANCKVGSDDYNSAKRRIEVHIWAAANRVVDLRKKEKDSKIELILGAFGCGAFVPKANPQEYRSMIAAIYMGVLEKYTGVFDLITFAIPDSTNLASNEHLNHTTFKYAIATVK